MDFTSLFLFFFGAIGVFNSFLLGLYFIFYKKPKQLSGVLFGLFLLFISERAFRSLIYFFSDISPNVYSTFGPLSFLFIGPFLLLYILSVVRPKHAVLRQWKYYILLWIAVAVAAHLIVPFRADPIFYKKYILTTINLQWLLHLGICAAMVRVYLKNRGSIADSFTPMQVWLLGLLAGVAILWLIYFFVSFEYFVVGSIVFSAIFYSFYIYFLFQKKVAAAIFQIGEKYGNKKLDNAEATALIEALKVLMDTEKPFKKANLKSSDLAQRLQITPHRFSQLLNDNLGKPFSTFVNEYRVEEAKEIIRNNTKYTLDAIGNESGFNSKSSFYAYFKRQVGSTPSQYREQILSSEL